MYFESFQAAIEMEGHGMFVWPAYMVTVLVLIGVFVAPLQRRKRLLRQISGAQNRVRGSQATPEADQ